MIKSRCNKTTNNKTYTQEKWQMIKSRPNKKTDK